jgi:hypothetical protein
METRNEGILAIKCRDLVIENVRVIDNRSSKSARSRCARARTAASAAVWCAITCA